MKVQRRKNGSRNLTALTARFDVADRRDHRGDAPVFNRAVTLRDTWMQKGD